MADSPTVIVLCVSIHDVIKAEQILVSEKIVCDMVPVPKEIDSSCGMALEIHPQDISQTKNALEKSKVRVRAFVQVQDGNFIILSS